MEQYNYKNLYSFDLSIEKEQSCSVIGTDEAGRGPLAGPVVAAAVQLDLSNPIEGINDSKKLSAKKRKLLYNKISSQAISWSIGHASPEEIDSINILQASLLAMKRALDNLNTQSSMVLIDGNRTINDFSGTRQFSIIHGDGTSASIAAASIVAKVTRDRLMMEYHEKYPEYGFNTNKGYPTKEHRRQVVKYGLTPIHRKSFCEKLLTQTELSFT